MKITIDTVSDSKEDLRKVIGLLQQFVGETSTSSGSDDFSVSSEDNIFGMFDNDASEEKKKDVFGNEITEDVPEDKDKDYNIQIVDEF